MAQIYQLFKKAMDRYGVQGKELAAMVGISPNHLSDFRNGKKWVSQETLTSLLEGMEQLSPGSKRYFCELLAGEQLGEKEDAAKSLVKMIEAANDDEMEAAMIAIGRKWKQLRLGRIHNEDVDQAIAV
ncbi:Helix-turn-helix protein (plasmid) [Nostoc sp. PCC 7524]|uniref:helix-turn-helix domain-containing protein n=1 Tax=Nostoc sp. (strain ATCC 29411 / PCC 7524) TaxID=28072 RepID=UPI00029ED2EA|nr:helix-turn-helix transcriptional regulator [Nostoc sp. PCC 7524]AFY51340.1 Helix-turn-helix protein [Nostoc sp. PCC 7524]